MIYWEDHWQYSYWLLGLISIVTAMIAFEELNPSKIVRNRSSQAEHCPRQNRMNPNSGCVRLCTASLSLEIMLPQEQLSKGAYSLPLFRWLEGSDSTDFSCTQRRTKQPSCGSTFLASGPPGLHRLPCADLTRISSE